MKNLSFYFQKAIKNHFAIGAFNFQSLESLKAICSAAEKTKSPVIVAISEGALNFLGDEFAKEIVFVAKKQYRAPIFLHLDHGKTFEICKKAISLGFDSVMIDASFLPFEQNIALTKKVSDYAHKHNVFVEGELGKIDGTEDQTTSTQKYTDPQQAKLFVEKTKVDSLAVSIGTSHGAYKFSGRAELRFDILSQIEQLLPSFPLVLHGASSVDQKLIKQINNFGGDIKGGKGVSQKLLLQAITKHNIVKINTDTDLRIAFTLGIRKSLESKKDNFDPRIYIKEGQNMIEKVVLQKIMLFGSNNQA